MWTNENRGRYDRSKLRYPSDLTDDEWKLVEPLIPPGKPGGGKRTVIMREVVKLSPGQMNDQPMAELLLNNLPAGADVIADKGYDADWIRDLIEDQDCTPHIPPKSNRYDGITYSKAKYKTRNLIERCFNKLKQFRHIATRYDRNALNYLAMAKIACLRLWLRFYESAA